MSEDVRDASEENAQRRGRVASEGTAEEKRRLIRTFTKAIELDPKTGNGRVQLLMLPDSTAAARYEPPTARSSSIMVAGDPVPIHSSPLTQGRGFIAGQEGCGATESRPGVERDGKPIPRPLCT